jgi:hypothetical protein
MKNAFNWKGILPLTLSGCLLMSLASCGGDSNGSSGGGNDNPQTEQTQDGEFRAILNPENSSVSSAVGTTNFSISGDNFQAKVVIASAKLGTHAQHIHTGTRCPTDADDTNNDGVVDATEATAVYGPVLLALDSNLGAAGGNFPSGVAYNYDQSDSLSKILTNLNLEGINLEGKVVNIHGVPETTTLPSTISGGKAAFPVSCGVLVKTGGTTGTSTAAATAAAAAAAATTAASASSSADSSSTGDTGASTGATAASTTTGTTTGTTGTSTGAATTY